MSKDFKKWLAKFRVLGYLVENLDEDSALVGNRETGVCCIYYLKGTEVKKSKEYEKVAVLKTDTFSIVFASSPKIRKRVKNVYTLDKYGRALLPLQISLRALKITKGTKAIVITNGHAAFLIYGSNENLRVKEIYKTTVVLADIKVKIQEVKHGTVIAVMEGNKFNCYYLTTVCNEVELQEVCQLTTPSCLDSIVYDNLQVSDDEITIKLGDDTFNSFYNLCFKNELKDTLIRLRFRYDREKGTYIDTEDH